MNGRIVLAFSGGTGSSAALESLARSSEIVAVIVDAGQPRGLEGLRERAVALGARRVHVVDGRDEFLERYMLPALQIGHFSEAASAADAALQYPFIARVLCDVAAMEDAAAIAHGAPAGSTTADRFDSLIMDCGFGGVILPRPAGVEPSAPASSLEHATVEGWTHAVCGSGPHPGPGDRAVYRLTRDPASAPGSASVAITFADGRPTAVNGVRLSLAELAEVVTTIAGDHGIGRLLAPGAGTGWTVVEAPAAVVLTAAFTSLCGAAGGADATTARAALGPAFRVMLGEGRWRAPVGDAIHAFIGALAGRIAGTAHLELSHGECRVSRADVDRAPVAAPVARRA
jgi:argininosuccinate synthase